MTEICVIKLQLSMKTVQECGGTKCSF